jgi:hypothetical protein
VLPEHDALMTEDFLEVDNRWRAWRPEDPSHGALSLKASEEHFGGDRVRDGASWMAARAPSAP